MDRIARSRNPLSAANGPTSSRDVEHLAPGREDGVWRSSNRAELLETLWDMGQVMICSRRNNQRYYDLTERLVAPELLTRASEAASLEFVVRQSFR